MRDPGRGQDESDLYGVLGVCSDAPHQEIVRAYHRAAHAAHPDSQPGDPEAGTRFRALTEAYDVLSDPARRARYDSTSTRPGPPAGQVAGDTDAAASRQPDSRPVPRENGFPVRVPPLWAGPVHVEPPSGRPVGHPQDEAAELALLHRYLGGGWGRHR